MSKTGKIFFTAIGAVAIFAVGVQYSPQVLAFLDKVRSQLGGKASSEIDALKDKITSDFANTAQVNGVSVQNDPATGQFVMITVTDNKTLGTVQKYIDKNNIGSKARVSLSSKIVAQ